MDHQNDTVLDPHSIRMHYLSTSGGVPYAKAAPGSSHFVCIFSQMPLVSHH